MRPADIELHIEELILRGFSPADRDRIAWAVEQELTRLLATEGTPPSLGQGGEIARVDGGTFEVAQQASAEATGAQVARAVYGGLSR